MIFYFFFFLFSYPLIYVFIYLLYLLACIVLLVVQDGHPSPLTLLSCLGREGGGECFVMTTVGRASH